MIYVIQSDISIKNSEENSVNLAIILIPKDCIQSPYNQKNGKK